MSAVNDKTVLFVKMEGAGNDYVYVDGIRHEFALERAPECARRWSDRHFGIGADGLIVLLRGDTAPVRMAMWNADGSRGAMCGNGLRCLAALAFDHGHVTVREFDVDTDAGPRPVKLLGDDRVRTAMGDVRCGEPRTLEVAGETVTVHPGDAGNPHAVIFVDDVETAPVERLGKALQSHPTFPGGVNVEFVATLGPATLAQRTFERGSGETLACGTGAAVAALAGLQTERVLGPAVDVRLRGGDLRIFVDGTALAIEGSARTVFSGEIALP
ncbi:MAG: diaminopimelate epimerase [bacterium]|nr:diaminopimelate epimerase [bacterium]